MDLGYLLVALARAHSKLLAGIRHVLSDVEDTFVRELEGN